MEAVSEAFRSGTYNDGGIVYSGNSGDLAATVSAILLRPDAMTPEVSSTVQGGVRADAEANPFLALHGE